MKKSFFLLLFISLLVACSSPEITVSPTVAPSQDAVTLTLSGSGGGTTILKAITDPFTIAQSETILDFLPGSGGTASKNAVLANQLDLGILLTADIASESIPGITILPLAEDPLAFVTHEDLELTGLTSAQLQDIYFGRITNWQEVGGPDATIIILTRNADEASTEILRTVLFGDEPITSSAVVLNKASEMRQAVSETTYSIGFMSYGDYVIKNLAGNIVPIDGQHPKDYSLGSYPFPSRTMAIAYNPNNLDKLQPLLDYLKSAAVAETMNNNGVVPIK